MIKAKQYSFIDHLEELRKCIIKSVLSLVVAAGCMCPFAKPFLEHILKSVGDVVFIAPQEAFIAHIKVALFCGVIISLPYVLYQFWQFIAAGLYEKERKSILFFLPVSVFFFVGGAMFGYGVIVPVSMRFLLGFQTELIVPMISVSAYISFVGGLTCAFGIVFELPIISLFLTRVGIITPHFLTEKRKISIVLIFILAAILTPPDIVTQSLMAVPLLVLYEVGILFSKMVYKKGLEARRLSENREPTAGKQD